MAALHTQSPNLSTCLGPLLPVLPTAAVSGQPPDSILPYLTPILRQRVQLLSSTTSTEPWIRLLCYDAGKAAKLAEIAQSDRLVAHPVSGEVEVDWEYDAETHYRRLDEETLQALVVLMEMPLSFRLVYCTGDPEGDGWKVGEVGVFDTPPHLFFGWFSSISEAERRWHKAGQKIVTPPVASQKTAAAVTEDEDDDYWGRYDATPARTPAPETAARKRALAPGATEEDISRAEEADYYAQYDSVQPAMDNHDPDEEVESSAAPRSALTEPFSPREPNNGETAVDGAQGLLDALSGPPRSPSGTSGQHADPSIAHPQAAGSAASSQQSVAKLELVAENFGVRQHISRSIKSLFMLSRVSGIDRDEFTRLVKLELETLEMLEY